MNKIYLVQYKFSNEVSIEARLKSIASSWVKYFDNNWIIESTLSAKELYQQITAGFTDISIIIIELDKKNYYGMMKTSVWDWIKKRV